MICTVVGIRIKILFGNLFYLMSFFATIATVSAYTIPLTRRGFISKSKAVSLVLGGTIAYPLPRPANALEKRNEALCATGFFTNIAQYKCTEIGDISGDGKAKQLSRDEEASADSLMGKLGLDQSTSFSTLSASSEDNVSTVGAQSDTDERK
ncbi:hypothetical protein HJC23_003958 [Cyclotella cryptica]|uniref:Uncharacterized protein n=1 Tax=Cyclotella cryptica TaxID=29204 RepID=A0ABD3PWH1_9STRA|eukprot:CCRYP_011493-RA/>CCRYP_011493-RA protein AED:0.47 eAED:0.47 QI:0/-1/0/1/-1/1/1/0/151